MIVALATLVLALVVVLLPFTLRSDVVSKVMSMAILIGALAFARFLDRRSGMVVTVRSGAITAGVPVVPASKNTRGV